MTESNNSFFLLVCFHSFIPTLNLGLESATVFRTFLGLLFDCLDIVFSSVEDNTGWTGSHLLVCNLLVSACISLICYF